MVRKL